MLLSLVKGRPPGNCCNDSTFSSGVHHMLQAEPGKWADWVALGTVELADLVDSQLTEIADWELNLKMLKVQLPSLKSNCTPISLRVGPAASVMLPAYA